MGNEPVNQRKGDFMKRVMFFCVATVLLPLFAFAADVSEPESVKVTIYNGDLALIREQRSFDLEGGVAVYELSEVSGRLQPETVHLSFDGGFDFELLEQNYDYDLVSREKLLTKFIGKEILIIDDEHGQQFRGTLLSVSGGMVLEVDGQIMLDPPGRVVLPAGSADDLRLRPTLSWMLWCSSAGSRKGEISYLSSGLDWHADYVVLLNDDDSAGDIEGWVTISNYSGTTYHDAELKLVAGDVNRVQPEMKYYNEFATAEAAPMAGRGGGFEEESFFEYHLYDLQRPTTLKNSQQKQIGLLTAQAVPFNKIFEFNGNYGGDVRVMVEFTNDKESGMGMPLPKGTVRVFKEDSEGDAQFIGEDRIDHTPKDEDVRLFVGNAFDVVGEAVQMDYKDIGKGYTATQKVTLNNHKENEDIVVTVPFNVWGEWKITSSNFDYEQKSATTVEFNVPVGVDEEVVLEFTYKRVWR